jgi:hypothetical protein
MLPGLLLSEIVKQPGRAQGRTRLPPQLLVDLDAASSEAILLRWPCPVVRVGLDGSDYQVPSRGGYVAQRGRNRVEDLGRRVKVQVRLFWEKVGSVVLRRYLVSSLLNSAGS